MFFKQRAVARKEKGERGKGKGKGEFGYTCIYTGVLVHVNGKLGTVLYSLSTRVPSNEYEYSTSGILD